MTKAPEPVSPRPSRAEAEAAVRTLIAYIGDNPNREGLLDTPKRVVGAYEELYRGYRECPAETLELAVPAGLEAGGGPAVPFAAVHAAYVAEQRRRRVADPGWDLNEFFVTGKFF